MSGKRRRARLHDIAGIAAALREPVETPDFTGSILERVHAEKPFLDKRARRWVPLARLGAAGAVLLGIFVFTLVIFVKPRLPEQMGAPVSVTTELVSSAEDGLAQNVASLRREQRDLTRLLFTATTMPPRVAEPISDFAARPIELADAPVFPATRPEGISESQVASFIQLTAPASMPLEVGLPPMPMAADFASTTFPVASDTQLPGNFRSSVAWSRTAAWSQGRGVRQVYVPVSFSARPLNQTPALLVKDLVPVITGQPAGDESLIIR